MALIQCEAHGTAPGCIVLGQVSGPLSSQLLSVAHTLIVAKKLQARFVLPTRQNDTAAGRFTAAGPTYWTSVLAGASERVEWHNGYVFDAPPGPYDAATCLLTLHFVPDDGSKERTLTEIRRRLKPGAPFVLVDLCIDIASPESSVALNRYREYALESGADLEQVNGTCERLINVLKMVSPARNEELLGASGFTDIELFYAALSWRGWRACA